MSDIYSYIREYGKKTFEQEPFNEVDALIFSQLAYVNFSGLVCKFDSDVKISLKEAAYEFFELYDEDYLKSLISISYKASEILKLCAASKRFSNVRLLKYDDNVNEKIDKQFSGVNFYISPSLAVIAFRGTDTTLTGIKESAMLSYMFPVPAQIEALHYFQESALIANRDVIICGHSKGGNLAVFAGLNCSNSTKRRIKGIYEFDAPGFPKEVLSRYDYVQIKDKVYSYIPQRSIIGRMLYHDTSLKIVNSENENLKQHQVSSWQIKENHFIFVDETDSVSKFIDKYLKQLSNDIGEENIEEVFETVFTLLEDAGVKEFDDFKKFDIQKLFKAIRALKSIDEQQAKIIEETFKSAVKEFSQLMYHDRITDKFQIKSSNDNKEE